jgi:hypothetical protein
MVQVDADVKWRKRNVSYTGLFEVVWLSSYGRWEMDKASDS